MDAFCNSLNWRKVIVARALHDILFELIYNKLSASTMLRKMTAAIPQAIVHHRALSAFTDSLRTEHGGNLVNNWEAQVILWEKNHKEKCPYDLPELST